jgi:hypothetical protein
MDSDPVATYLTMAGPGDPGMCALTGSVTYRASAPAGSGLLRTRLPGFHDVELRDIAVDGQLHNLVFSRFVDCFGRSSEGINLGVSSRPAAGGASPVDVTIDWTLEVHLMSIDGKAPPPGADVRLGGTSGPDSSLGPST